MRLYFRAIPIIIAGLRRKKDLSLQEESKIRLRVMPWDCAKRIVSNTRFHAFLPIAKMDLTIRLGWLPLILQHKWKPALLSCHIRHLYPVHVFDELIIRSYIIQTSKKFIWIGHRFECKGQIVCTAITKLSAPSTSGIANIELLMPRAHFTHHITKHNVELLPQPNSTIQNV